MQYTLSFIGKRVRQGLVIGGIVLFGLLAQCSEREEPPPPPAEESPQSLVDQYKDASKSTAENPGLAGAPGQMKEEEQQSE